MISNGELNMMIAGLILRHVSFEEKRKIFRAFVESYFSEKSPSGEILK
jgi:hypothetical protein